MFFQNIYNYAANLTRLSFTSVKKKRQDNLITIIIRCYCYNKDSSFLSNTNSLKSFIIVLQ